MDPRRAIFRLWTEPRFEKKRKLVEEYLKCGKIEEAIYELGCTGFICGRCNMNRAMLMPDLLWVIATCPEQFLYEGEFVVCGSCMEDVSKKILIAERNGPEKYLSLDYRLPRFLQRYVYNPFHNYYIFIDRLPLSRDEKQERNYDIVFRSKCPMRNPFFQIDNSLFTILSAIHLN